MKKVVALILVLIMAASLFAGCSSTPKANAETTSQKTDATGTQTSETKVTSLEGKKIACIQKGMQSNYWIYANQGSIDAAKALNVKVDIFSPTEADNNEEQLDLIEQCIAQQYDIICIAPADSAGIVPGIQACNEAGIPVILYTNTVNGDCDYESIIHISDHDTEYTITKYLCEELKKGDVICLEGKSGAQNSMDKAKGAADAIAEYPDIKLVASQAADWSQTTAYTVMQNLLQAYPNVDAIVACNDQMAAGAVQALQEAKIADGKVKIVGMNADLTACDYIKDGTMLATIDNMPYELGYNAVSYAVKLLQGEKIESDIFLDPILVTPANVDEIIAKRVACGDGKK